MTAMTYPAAGDQEFPQALPKSQLMSLVAWFPKR